MIHVFIVFIGQERRAELETAKRTYFLEAEQAVLSLSSTKILIRSIITIDYFWCEIMSQNSITYIRILTPKPDVYH